MNTHTTEQQRKRVKEEEGRKILCANIYNDYKCWNNTRCCDYLKDNTKCPAFIRIRGEE
jgi:hypothetical protein